MELRALTVERYKAYSGRTELELAPLTILVGANNAGKSALAQAFQLVAGGLTVGERAGPEPLPLESGGIRHGRAFEDLVTGRSLHGSVRFGLRFSAYNSELDLSVRIQNVETPDGASERQISEWKLTNAACEFKAERLSLARNSLYRVAQVAPAGVEEPDRPRPMVWRGLLPADPNSLSPPAESCARVLREWAQEVRHLRCPRALARPPYPSGAAAPSTLGPDGENAPFALVANESLRDSVRAWYRDSFGVGLEARTQGPWAELVVRHRDRRGDVPLAQSGAGLAQVLPVVLTALTASGAKPGIEVIEHPEAELHPAAHAWVADLLLNNLPGPRRPVVVETHSEMLLLRARRWIAEGKLAPDQVVIYWISQDAEGGSSARRIRITESGDVDGWPDDVFIENYEELLAIRRARR